MLHQQTKFYRAVCHANNHAARLLVLGSSHAAKDGFRTALNCLRNRSEDVHFSGGGKRTLCSCNYGEEQASVAATKTQLFRLSFHSDDEAVSPHNAFCFYNRIMMVHEDETDDSFLCMVILFNLAITYHHLGLTDIGQDSLKKALELYKMVLAVTQQCKDYNMNKNEDSVVRLILLATFSNMGHIYSHFISPYEEKVCQQQLLAVMAGASLFLDAEEAQKFQINAYQRAEWAPAA